MRRRASRGRVAVCEPLPQRSCEAGLAAASGEACCGAVQTSGRRVGNARVLGLNPQPAHIEPSLQSRGFLRRQPSPHNPISQFLLLGEASSYRTGSLRTGGRRRGTKSCGRGPCRVAGAPGSIKCESLTSAGASAWSCGASRNLPRARPALARDASHLVAPLLGLVALRFFSRFLCARLLFNYGCLHFTFLGCPLRGLRSNPPKPAKKALHVSRGVQKPAISSLGVVWMTRFCLRPQATAFVDRRRNAKKSPPA